MGSQPVSKQMGQQGRAALHLDLKSILIQYIVLRPKYPTWQMEITNPDLPGCSEHVLRQQNGFPQPLHVL